MIEEKGGGGCGWGGLGVAEKNEKRRADKAMVSILRWRK